jgi:hypothetical protein
VQVIEFEVLAVVVKKVTSRAGSSWYLFHASFLLGLLFGPEDGGNMFFRNVG